VKKENKSKINSAFVYFPCEKEHLKNIIKTGIKEQYDMTKQELVMIRLSNKDEWLYLHKGNGIYVFNTFEGAIGLIDNDLDGVEHPIIVTINMNIGDQSLLMDELDMTKSFNDRRVCDGFNKLYPKISKQYKLLASVMELSVKDLQSLRIHLINTYKLKPDNRLPGYGDGSYGLIARCPFDISSDKIADIHEYSISSKKICRLSY